MRQVSKEEFFGKIGNLNVEVSVVGQYRDPEYGTAFKLGGEVIGRIIMRGDHPDCKPRSEYFLK